MKTLFVDFYHDFKHYKHYFFASILIFAIGIYTGYTMDSLHAVLNSQIQGLKQLAHLFDKMNLSPAELQLAYFVLIFLNNSLKALLFIFAGGFFWVFPVYSMLLNGMIMGYLFEITVAQGESLTHMIVMGILPHGILELPAILLAAAYGMRFGTLILKGMISLLAPPLRVSVKAQLIHFFRMSLPLMMLLGVVLFAAAAIESTVTFSLMR